MISSTANSRVKHVVQLREKGRERKKEGVFLAEGIRMFQETPVSRIRELYIEEELAERLQTEEGNRGSFDRKGDEAKGRAEVPDRTENFSEKVEACRQAGIFVETVSTEVMKKMADTMSPQGVLLVAEMFDHRPEELIREAVRRRKEEGRDPLFLLLEDVQDPGNLGTMIRTAEGAGADGIFMTEGCVDIYNPKTIRSTMGSLYRMPFVCGVSLPEVIGLLQKEKITTYAAHLKGEKFFHEIDYRGGSAFLIGNEGNGLREETADLADTYLKIPMEGKLESLNAAMAAGLLMYQSRYGGAGR